MPVRKCLVIGAGLGGLGAAAAMAQKGIDVDVIEVKQDIHVAGVGINQPGNSLRALNELGVLEDCLSAGFQFDRNEHFDWAGNPIVVTPSALGDERVPSNCALARADLHRILLGAARSAGARITFGVTVADLREDDNGVTVALTDGSVTEHDAVIGFDGIGSALRRRLFGDAHEPEYTGYAVWRASLPRPSGVTHTMLFHGDRSNTGLIPLARDRMYLLHVHPEPDRTRYAPERFDALLRERLADYGGLIVDARDCLPGPEGIVYSPISEVQLPPPWNRGRAIVLGDAAHASAPNLTQGAAMALEDALVLSDELTDDKPMQESLATVSASRYPRTKLVQDVSRSILEAEMGATSDGIARSTDLRRHLPGQVAALEGDLNKPIGRASGPRADRNTNRSARA